jgi:hypothetical protein
MIPNYGGIYGRLQRYFDPENLAIHNLNIMSCDAMTALVPDELVESARAFRFGRINAWQVSLHRKWPSPIAKLTYYLLNGIGMLQPVEIAGIAPGIALEMKKIR